MYKILPSATS